MAVKRTLVLFSFCAGLAGGGAVCVPGSSVVRPAQAQRPVAAKSSIGRVMRRVAAARYGHLPLGFERNRGQFDRRVDFLARGRGYALFLSRGDAVLALGRPAAAGSGGAVGGERYPGRLGLPLV